MSPIELNRRLELDIRTCRRCEDEFRHFAVHPGQPERGVAVPRPIVTSVQRKRVMLIGQAPGLTEYEVGKPFQGSAGQSIRSVFAEAGVPLEDFDELVYSTGVIKCFPGSKLTERGGRTRREDVTPSPRMIRNCQPFLGRQVALVDPKVIVLLGVLPLISYLKQTGRTAAQAKLKNFVGCQEAWAGRSVIFLPHTSGASTWFNDPQNTALLRQAKDLLRKALACPSN